MMSFLYHCNNFIHQGEVNVLISTTEQGQFWSWNQRYLWKKGTECLCRVSIILGALNANLIAVSG